MKKKYLNFSEDFIQQILNGDKCATLRLGFRDYRKGERVIITAGDRELAVAVIKDVRFKKFRDITDTDAKLDGFKTKDALRRALIEFYGEFEENAVFTQIIFEIEKIIM